MRTNQLFETTCSMLQEMELPLDEYTQDNFQGEQFDAGGHYGIELSSMNNAYILHEVVKSSKKLGITIDRADECRGIFRLPNHEIKEMVNICIQEQIGLILSIGPRSIYDSGGFIKTANGSRLGYRLRGMDNLIYAVEDVKRAIDYGVRGFLIYDEGLLCLLGRMRNEGMLPKNLIFKISVHMGCANPLSAKLYYQLGANSINLIPDLNGQMITACRKLVPIPLDIFTDTAKEAGNFIRSYEIPHLILSSSPVYLKCGAVSQPYQNHLPTMTELEERIKQTKIITEFIERYTPESCQVNKSEVTLAIPQ